MSKSKITSKAVFKSYDQQQFLLLPPQLDELIASNHLVRVVNSVVEGLDLSSIVNQYEGGGSSSYHPKMMVKVLLYGYAMKIYTGRRLAKALSQDITFMWLAAYNRPDFRTINLFRSGILKETIEELFKQLLLFLVDHGYVKVENYFTDGTTFSADANRHKVVWRKNAERYRQIAQTHCQNLFKDIDALNAEEDKQYGDHDLEELSSQPIDSQIITNHISKLNEVVGVTADKRLARKGLSLKRKLEEEQAKIVRYDQQLSLSGDRSGYSKTDTDATVMYLKNDDLVPAYNVLASSENQFITGYSVHQNPNDATCFKEHLEHLPLKPVTLTGDSIFGTEQNYELLEGNDIESYLKYPTFHAPTKKGATFSRENFLYNKSEDSYTCPQNRKLTYKSSALVKHKKTGYQSTVKIYESESCLRCPLSDRCKKAEFKRTLTVNNHLDFYKQNARRNLCSEKGLALRKRRGAEIESCFGDFKQNMGFRRFHLRGKQKAGIEIGLISMAHNLRKIQLALPKAA